MKKIISVIIGLLLLSSTAFGEELVEDPAEGGADELEEEIYHGEIFMEGEFLNGDLLKISVLAQDMLQPILGIAFHLNFDNENLAFLKYEPGDFLERGGDPFYLVKNQDSGRVIFGETLRKDDSFPVGEGRVVDYYFQILTEGEFNFSFVNGVISTLDVVRQDIDKILWEDLVIERGDNEEIITFSGGATSIFRNDSFKISNIIPWLGVILGGIFSYFIYFYWKKQEKKTPTSSVNFK